jgi:hypothetical protein
MGATRNIPVIYANGFAKNLTLDLDDFDDFANHNAIPMQGKGSRAASQNV